MAGGHSSYFALTRAVTAVPHAQSGPLGDYASYAQLYNVLGMPAGVVAATCVRPDEESDHPPSKDAVEQAAHMADQGSAGLPVGVLVVARHWREDVALAVMAALWRLGCAVAMPRRGALPCAARARPA